MNSLRQRKIGFIGTGNLSQSIIEALIASETVSPSQIFASNRSDKKLSKLTEVFKVNSCKDNEEVVDKSDIVFIGVKPQDFLAAVEPIAMTFGAHHIVISLAAGISTKSIQKLLSQTPSIIRVMANSPIRIRSAVMGYCFGSKCPPMDGLVKELLSPAGMLISVKEEEQMGAVTVGAASGTGFVFELMQYWQGWLEDYGFEEETARKMTIETFLGAAKLAANDPSRNLEMLQDQVVSKKGTTAAGLDSMREMELERVLRYSFEKAILREQELAKIFS